MPTPDLLNQNLHFNKTSKWSGSTWEFEKHWGTSGPEKSWHRQDFSNLSNDFSSQSKMAVGVPAIISMLLPAEKSSIGAGVEDKDTLSLLRALFRSHTYLPTCYWLELNHMVTPSCKEYLKAVFIPGILITSNSQEGLLLMKYERVNIEKQPALSRTWSLGHIIYRPWISCSSMQNINNNTDISYFKGKMNVKCLTHSRNSTTSNSFYYVRRSASEARFLYSI